MVAMLLWRLSDLYSEVGNGCLVWLESFLRRSRPVLAAMRSFASFDALRLDLRGVKFWSLFAAMRSLASFDALQVDLRGVTFWSLFMVLRFIPINTAMSEL